MYCYRNQGYEAHLGPSCPPPTDTRSKQKIGYHSCIRRTRSLTGADPGFSKRRVSEEDGVDPLHS